MPCAGHLPIAAPGSPGAGRSHPSRPRPFVYVRRQVSPEQARRVAALNMEGVGFIKENRRFYPNKELAAHCSATSASTTTVWRARSDVRRADRWQARHGPDSDRRAPHAFSRIEQPPTAGASLELTIDQYMQHIAERELHAGVEASRAAGGIGDRHGSAYRRDSGDGERSDLQSERLSERDSDAPPNRAVQDLYEPGSTFKIVTAGAALEEKVVAPDDLIDTEPRRDPVRRPRHQRSQRSQLRNADVRGRHRQVEQRRRDQDRPQARRRIA